MQTKLKDNPHAISDIRKIIAIGRKLHRLNIDKSALQKTRLPERGYLKPLSGKEKAPKKKENIILE
jgi:hypothetical protein